MFDAIDARESSAEACAAAIRRAVLSGAIAPGERLPPEREMAAQFGVNRLTLRTALGQLTASGLLAVRQGSGYRVRDYRDRGGPDLLRGLADVARERGSLAEVAADLLLVRRQLARAVLERLAAAPAIDVGPIEAAIDAFAGAVARGADTAEIAAADVEVLVAIVGATGSAVLRLCVNPVAAVLAELPELCAVIYARPETNVAGWRTLLAWLGTREAAGIDRIVAILEERDHDNIARLT